MTKKGSWDKGIDLENFLILVRQKIKRAKRAKTKTYLAILYIQAINGSRVSEAVRAFKEWVKTGERIVSVKVSKKRKKEVYREMYIPKLLDKIKQELDLSLAGVDEQKLVRNVKVFAVRNLKVNTHSLRYAFITFLATQGIESALIAKYIGHADLRHITGYIQSKQASTLLRNLMSFLDED